MQSEVSFKSPMTQRQRKLAGTIALIALITVYALLALAVAVVLQVRDANKAVEFAYYVVAGLLWVLPAGWLIWWMQKPDA
jgi:prepilin signal peptidase PulO-like enzyme (type II secretory pathway)